MSNEVKQLRAIANAAWAVRVEEADYNLCPDLMLRANAKKHLRDLVDEWRAAQPKQSERQ